MSGSHPSRTRVLLPVAAVLSVTALLATGCSAQSDAGAPGSSTGVPAAHDAAVAASSGGNGLQNAYQDAVRNVLPSVVQITTNTDLGSGVVFDTKGDIVTNAHVVGKAKNFKVSLATGGKALDAKLLSAFPASDLAVIRLTSTPSGLKTAAFADSSKVAVGQIVLAMGNPLGLSGSVTEGIVSATGRTVSESQGGSNSTGATIPDLIQTSAAINPGNSGGALVNLDNQVIGIPTLAATDPQLGSGAAPGIGFAIPSSTVVMIANQIITNGKVTNSGRAALDVTVRGVVGKNFLPSGAAIVTVEKNGAAAKAGLRAGDVITKLGNTTIGTVQSLTDALARLKPGNKVRIEFGRGNTGHAAEVTLGTL
ncbi:S1C family serine protease [Streptomyces polygonati]|uniref:S1C family serine protease n=1 Tax=Streptomyces polygonati TaxID=1617087 RepID=A0ABV8HDV2_9ACTN